MPWIKHRSVDMVSCLFAMQNIRLQVQILHYIYIHEFDNLCITQVMLYSDAHSLRVKLTTLVVSVLETSGDAVNRYIPIYSLFNRGANPRSSTCGAGRIICVCFLSERRDCVNLLWEREKKRSWLRVRRRTVGKGEGITVRRKRIWEMEFFPKVEFWIKPAFWTQRCGLVRFKNVRNEGEREREREAVRC